MKTYEESQKSKKTVASMIENKKEDKKKKEEKSNKGKDKHYCRLMFCIDFQYTQSIFQNSFYNFDHFQLLSIFFFLHWELL